MDSILKTAFQSIPGVYNSGLFDLNVIRHVIIPYIRKPLTRTIYEHNDVICKINDDNGDMECTKDNKLHRENGPALIIDDSVYWYQEGKLHREDGPAVEMADGYEAWYKNGVLHRKDGPAILRFNKEKKYEEEWWINGEKQTGGPRNKNKKYYIDISENEIKHYRDGKLFHKINKEFEYWYDAYGKFHKKDGPAVEQANGYKEWYINGKRHREDGPAREMNNGDKEWYINGELHRENGLPAIERASGGKSWWVNGERHRENGLPAIEYANGRKAWYINGELQREDEA